MAKAKKTNRRSQTKHANLNTNYNLLSRRDLIDYDYLNKLSPEELEFLDKFTAETINASLDSKILKNNLYARTKKKKKECFDANNGRNRDILTIAKAQGKAIPMEEAFSSEEELHELLMQTVDESENGDAD